jgi:hypothetical protein
MKENAVQGNNQSTDKDEILKTDKRTEAIAGMRGRITGLRALRIAQATTSQKTEEQPVADFDEEPVLLLNPANESKPLAESNLRHQVTSLAGLVISTVWISYCAAYAVKFGDTFVFTPSELGAYAAGALAPFRRVARQAR